MKIAILSDIHGNIRALDAVLSILPKDITKLWILGDLVGYYYNSKEVLETLESYDCEYISGNHEILLKDCLYSSKCLDQYTKRYGSSLKRGKEELSDLQINFLTTLPHSKTVSIGNRRYFLGHGSPWDLDHYIYPNVDETDLNRFLSFPEDIFFLGHTHYPMHLNYKGKRIINPGSVGQPRNRKQGAHWAIFNTHDESITFKVTPYPIESLLLEIEEIDPNNEYLKTVLLRTL